MFLKYHLLFLACLFCVFVLYNSSADALALKSDSESCLSESDESSRLEEINKSYGPGRGWKNKHRDNWSRNKDFWNNRNKNNKDNWNKKNKDNWNKQDRDNKDNNDRIEFICPNSSGLFPDIRNCNVYYVCENKIAHKRRCGPRRNFDKLRKTCLPIPIAVCENGKDGFKCPSMQGQYPHPEDCSKFFECSNFMASSKICPEQKLFDGVQMRCRREYKVNCGSREKHTTLLDPNTFPVSTEKSTTISLTTTTQPTIDEKQPTFTETTIKSTNTQKPTTVPTTTKELTTIRSTMAEPTTFQPTSAQESTTEQIITKDLTTTQSTMEEPTRFQSTTTEKPKPTGPPETDCLEEDLDCIIRETGEISEWFKCPSAVSSFLHPSSSKLFVFCRNGKPKIKKCGQNRIFSVEKRNCV